MLNLPAATCFPVQDDYMSLEISRGNVIFKFDLGAGPANITNTKVVSDDNWHEVIVERYLFSVFAILCRGSKHEIVRL